MATPSDRSLDELIAEVAQAKQRVQAIYTKLRNARDATLPRIGRTDDGALIVAGYLETYYTVLETFFVRVSGFFENDLAPARWHSALLESMNNSRNSRVSGQWVASSRTRPRRVRAASGGAV